MKALTDGPRGRGARPAPARPDPAGSADSANGAGQAAPAGPGPTSGPHPVLGTVPSDPAEAFEEFFERHRHGLGRLAFLLTGNVTSAEDLTGDVFLAVWRQWSTISGLDAPVPYVRRMMVNTAASRSRSLFREWRRLLLVHGAQQETVRDPDGAVSVDVRAALLRLPVRRRACVVLRHAFDLSEAEVANVLGVTVGTVKSQTSKGMAQLHELLTATDHGSRWS